jgi:hypothetical protein
MDVDAMPSGGSSVDGAVLASASANDASAAMPPMVVRWPPTVEAARSTVALMDAQGFTLERIQMMPVGIALPLRAALTVCRHQ